MAVAAVGVACALVPAPGPAGALGTQPRGQNALRGAPPAAPSSPATGVQSALGVVPGDAPALLPPTQGPLLGVPQVVLPSLGAGPYLFPVFGPSSTSDDFGSLVPGADYEHGVIIAGSLGEPLVAVASGTLYEVGWSRSGGNRLWLRDGQGNEFYYSHLSAFAQAAFDGARVAAGEVIGFMGDSALGQQVPAELEFEVHPVSLVYLGAQGAVDPYPYIESWPHVTSVELSAAPGWLPSVPATLPAPQPGAYLVSSSTVASGGALSARPQRG